MLQDIIVRAGEGAQAILPARRRRLDFILLHRPYNPMNPTIGAIPTQKLIFVGLDVHRDTIAACVYDPASKRVCLEVELPSDDRAKLRKLMARIRGSFGEPRCCYEASSCGYTLYRTLTEDGVSCAVIAPSSIPRRAGDRVKTDRRDAEKLARYYAAGLLTAIHTPDPSFIATRSLVRRRVALVEDLSRTKQRAVLLLQSRGHVYRAGRNWTQKFWRWLEGLVLDPVDAFTLQSLLSQHRMLEAQIREVEQQIEEEAQKARYQRTVQVLQGFRGIGLFTAMQLTCEIGDIRRFAHPKALMAYLGLVPREHSSGHRTRRGSITKAGSTYARKALISAAWKYTHLPRRSLALQQRQRHCAAEVVSISWKAQRRLHQRYRGLIQRKAPMKAIVALARELVGFLWEALQTVPPTPLAHAA